MTRWVRFSFRFPHRISAKHRWLSGLCCKAIRRRSGGILSKQWLARKVSEIWGATSYARLQMLTMEEILEGKRFDTPEAPGKTSIASSFF